MKTIFDPSFKYTRSLETDVRKTFARVRREQRTSPVPHATGPITDANGNVLSLVKKSA
jgi:hypothetical protein